VGQTLLERVAAIAPGILERAQETEHLRRIPDASIAALRETGLFRTLVPARYGGVETSPPALWDVLIEVARACSATGWVASLLAIHGFVVARFDPKAQAEVWAAGPDALVASGVAPSGTGAPADGGLRVSGRWSYASGVDHSGWAVLNVHVRDQPDAKPASQFVLIPRADFVIDDDWHVAGLRGTGSKSVVVTDAFVPAHRILSGLALNAGRTTGVTANGGLFRISFPALFPLAFAPAAIGTALAMVEHYRAYTGTRRAAYTDAAFKGKPAAWLRLAEASADVDAARLLLARDLTTLADEAQRDAHLPATTERARYDAAYLVGLCARAVDCVYAGSGGRALYETSPLQRGFRDMHAITQHAATGLDDAGERYGRYLLG
jgi:3-hydroxy-9,10-secoandrosta-1,3,5(10)-triene-9,17-dione monooxygenase